MQAPGNINTQVYDLVNQSHRNEANADKWANSDKRSFVGRAFRPIIPKRLHATAITIYKTITAVPHRKSSVTRELEEIKKQLNVLQYHVGTIGTSRYQDIMGMLNRMSPISTEPNTTLRTDHPVAVDSADHLFPEGTAYDNTRSPRFSRVCEEYFLRKISYLDLGCAGGGLVLDFLLRGHFAIGIEGSDYSLKAQRAEWRLIPKNLFPTDITKPFEIVDVESEKIRNFDVISMWETLEHIKEHDLEQVFKNVSNHLNAGGIFIGSIGTNVSFQGATGIPLHMTVQEPEWWMKTMAQFGFFPMQSQPFEFEDFCRGTGNGLQDPYFKTTPSGFHFVVQKSNNQSQAGGQSNSDSRTSVSPGNREADI